MVRWCSVSCIVGMISVCLLWAKTLPTIFLMPNPLHLNSSAQCWMAAWGKQDWLKSGEGSWHASDWEWDESLWNSLQWSMARFWWVNLFLCSVQQCQEGFFRGQVGQDTLTSVSPEDGWRPSIVTRVPHETALLQVLHLIMWWGKPDCNRSTGWQICDIGSNWRGNKTLWHAGCGKISDCWNQQFVHRSVAQK